MNWKPPLPLEHYDQVFGLRVVVSDLLPITPTDGENARRIVRHGLKKALPWLDIDPGLKPFEATEMLIAYDPILQQQVLYVSKEIHFQLRLASSAFEEVRGLGNSDVLEKVWLTRDEWYRTHYGI